MEREMYQNNQWANNAGHSSELTRNALPSFSCRELWRTANMSQASVENTTI